jgi:hypothetical protein
MWSEIWPTMQGFLDQVYATGEAVCHDDLLFILERKGEKEETYFTFNPAFGDEGEICGVMAIVQETTSKVIALRERARAEE